LLRTIESVAKLQINKSFSTEFAHTLNSGLVLWARSAQKMLLLPNVWCRDAEKDPVIHTNRSE
jgi:hypothetical protein